MAVSNTAHAVPNAPPDDGIAGSFDRAYRGMLRGLYEARYVPGQRLAAPDLMADFAVSRGTIREVLNRLASSGVVTIVPNRGAEVRRLTRAEVTGLLDIVEVLVGLAARGAATGIARPDVRRALEQRDAALARADPHRDFAGFLAAREDYYRCIVRLSGNGELQRLFPIAQVQIMRTQLRAFGRAADALDARDYAALTAAILSGDSAAADRVGRRHVQLTAARVREVPDRAFKAADD